MSDDLPDNIKEFGTIAVLVFAQLYRAFPEPIDINREVVAAAMEIDASKWRELELPSGRRFNATLGWTIAWLNDEGFIRSSGGHPAERVRLTTKGLVAMNALPPDLHGDRVGPKLVEVARSSHIDASTIGDLIGGVIGGLTKSLGNG